ncbi:hypothetical protein AVEN_182018-1 [Araneus ventricosus]|uniref:Uncharacterized protein n=1 Tax=Araneus ventricosus TaxID=182803 RepID=A0A4Y2VYF3_ARAVE|nr:hypothetical protein AVEN_182018-1 [Araneus ventricosus]
MLIQDFSGGLQHEGYFRANLAILNLGHLTRATPELAHPLQSSAAYQWEDICSPTYDCRAEKAQYTTDFQRSRVSSLEPAGRKPRPYH